MKRYIKNILPAAAVLLTVGLSSCVGDLDVTPIDPNKRTEVDPVALFNQCYANLSIEGLDGPGKSTVTADDPGTTGLVRQLFNTNELTTDEAICAWTDPGVATMNTNEVGASNAFTAIYFNRLYSGISVCNHYLEVCSNVDATRTAEVRFLRALQFYLAMDAFGNISLPLIRTKQPQPRQKQAEVYAWLEKELLEIEPLLSEPKAKVSTDAGYGRADKAAAWMLLMRLYLNAQVYTGTAQWAKAAEYAQKVINSDYKLYKVPTGSYTAYQKLFMGDNGESGASVEAVLPLLQQGNKTAAYGNTTFLIASTYTDGMAEHGIGGKWGGNRARRELVQKFFNGIPAGGSTANILASAGDDRALFFAEDRTLEIPTTSDIVDFKKGYSVVKFTGAKSDGSASTHSEFADTDFFLFRVAEAYLAYAEATARTNGGNTTAQGVAYLNELRQRSNATTRTSYTLDEILDERSREFYFEGQRRTDLIRYGYFGGNNNHNWSWKGGAPNGRNFDASQNLFPIPSTEQSVTGN